MTREEAIKALTIQLEYWEQLKEKNVLTDHEGNNVVDVLKLAIETLQAEPVKHGEWETGLLREFRDTNIEAQEKADKAGYVRYVVNLKCSACGKITMVDNSIKYNFCPNCGAKMDKD